MTRRTWLGHCTALALACAGATASAQGAKPVILVVGDSLSAEYGLERGKGWVALMDAQLARDKIAATVVNASISGDTTSGGRSRLPVLLKQHRPTHVILELGGNDALRGLPLASTRDNLAAMTRASKEAGAKVLIVGMQVPPNYGRKYGEEFEAAFATVAKAENTGLVPFLLKGVVDDAHADAMFQADRIHPREQAHPIMMANVLAGLKPMLK